MKKLSLSLLLILFLILSMAITGCSSNGEDSAETSGAEASETSEAAADPSEASAAQSQASTEAAEDDDTSEASANANTAESSAADSSATAEASETSEAAADPSEASAAYQGISFETTDLDGNAVTAEELFSQHKLTMINLWGTYCGPCIGEMPDLEILSQRLAEKECAIVGIVVDVAGLEDTARLETAREIIADTGVTYMNLFPWYTLMEDFPAQFIPTSYFVNSEGQIVGEAAIGARGADDYEALIDELLGD